MVKTNSPFDLIVSKYEPKVRKALLDVFQQIKNEATVKKLVGALEKGGLTNLLMTLETIQKQVAPEFIRHLEDAIIESGRGIVKIIPKNGIKGAHIFSLVNPQTVEALNKHNLQLVQALTNDMRETALQVIRANMSAGNNPLKIAKEIRDTIGLAPYHENAVRNYRRMLENKDREALKRALRDKRYDKSLEKLINGKSIPQDKIDQMVEAYKRKMLNYRAATVARTETMRAVAMGEYMSLVQGVAEGSVDPNLRRFWVYRHDGKTRHAHTLIPSMNPEGVPVVGFFQTIHGPLLYPRDPRGLAKNTVNCRCRIQYKVIEPAISI